MSRPIPQCRLLAVLALLWLRAAALHAVEPYQAQTADPLLDRAQWHALTHLYGESPQCMVEDHSGAVWFGVATGAMRYTGMAWSRFGAAEGLAGKEVTALCCAADGTVFAGTEVGLFRFDRDRWQQVYPHAGAAHLAVRALFAGSDGSLWCSFAGRSGLFRLKGASCTIYTDAATARRMAKEFPDARIAVVPAKIKPNSHAFAIFEDRDHRMWFGTTGAVLRYDPREADASAAWRTLTPVRTGGPHWESYTAFCQTRDGRIWVSGNLQKSGLHCYDPGNGAWTFVNLAESFSTDAQILSLIETSDGALWAGGLGKLFRYQNGAWRLYQAPEVPLSSPLEILLETRGGRLLVLAQGDDVRWIDFRGRRWLNYKGLNFQCESIGGRQWFIAIDDRVVCRDSTGWREYGPEDGLMRYPYGLLQTGKGELWAAGSEGDRAVLARFDGATWHRFSVPAIGAFASIIDPRAMIETPDGSLWFGAYVDSSRREGILQYNPALGGPDEPQAWEVHSNNGYGSFGLAFTREGHVLNAYYRGLFEFDGRKWHRVENLPVDAITRSPAGDVWVGTRTKGVYRYGSGQPVAYTVKDGLRADGISALFVDRSGSLWVGTSNGISHFDGANWVTDVFPDQQLAIGRDSGGFRQSADGALWINQCSREWMRRALPGARMPEFAVKTFGTLRFQPQKLPPRTAFSSALKIVAQPGNAAFAWSGVDPWSVTAADKLEYSYRMDGGRWMTFKPITSHVFLQVPEGRHTFQVRARDGDGNIEPEPARAEFVVLPPVWRQPWFIALAVAGLAAVLTQTVRVIRRDRRLHAANRLLTEKTEALEQEVEERSMIQASLETQIRERQRMEWEVEKAHKELLLASRQAGMAEVATNVLHNVGNVLNSVNISAGMVAGRLNQLRAGNIAKVAELLEASGRTADSPDREEKRRQVPAFLKALGEHLSTTKAESLTELASLQKNIDHIKEIVAMQQTYAQLSGTVETLKVSEIVEDAIRMNAGALVRHDIELVRDYQDDGLVHVEKHQVLQILVNLIRNAKYACDESNRSDKRIVIRIERPASDRVQIRVIDNGAGIAPENRNRLFTFGFTTRKSGHGFGLHGSANAAKRLGGSLTAHSDGPGRGATFVLDLPMANAAPVIAVAVGAGDLQGNRFA